MSEEIVGRRTTLKYLALLAGTAAGREFLARWLPSGAKALAATDPDGLVTMPGMSHGAPPAEPAPPYSPQFFKPDEFQTVEALTEMVIPTDDQPGAKEARVADYIDFVVFAAAEFRPSLQREWTEGLAWLAKESQRRHHAPFREISVSDRERLLTDMSLPERDRSADASHPGYKFYRLVKGMTVEGFYTSRVGLIDVLGYQGLTFLSEFPGCTHPEHQT
ncbi:MAG TPA: gluconate 2-dehydrogenase subunit 3 family protein [Terriglobia bacterium]|nr:gluconate 2-dehydrogenase subunit 3 family protein [Terriglobia bacterium]